MKVAILGASNNPDRYAYRAQEMLMEYGHETFPISLSGETILGCAGYHSIRDIPEEDEPIDTVTLYLSPKRFAPVADEVAECLPRRVIFNPGTESGEIEDQFRDLGIEVVEGLYFGHVGEGPVLEVVATDSFEYFSFLLQCFNKAQVS